MVTTEKVGEQSRDGEWSKALIAETLRLYERYATEVVEELGFCPWAREARRQGQVQVDVLLGHPDVDQVLRHMEALAERESILIGLVIMPEANLERLPFQHFAAALREADRARAGDASPTWAVADFHPDAQADMASPERLVSYIRRSPDPTLQLVRHSHLREIRKNEDTGTKFVDPEGTDLGILVGLGASSVVKTPVHARVALRNFETIKEHGLAAIEKRIGNIHTDRHEAYARLGLRPAPWRR